MKSFVASIANHPLLHAGQANPLAEAGLGDGGEQGEREEHFVFRLKIVAMG
jgi:hypothetical protein